MHPIDKPEPNMLKTLSFIPSSTSQKITYYSYFILTSLPIIPMLFFCINVTSIDMHP